MSTPDAGSSPASSDGPIRHDDDLTRSWTPTPPPTAPAGASNRLRWVAAAVVTILVVAAGIGIALLAGAGKSSPPLGPTFLPAGSVAYLEARLDLPGDQQEHVAELISRFPGFADQAAFETKLDEVFEDWLTAMSEGDVSWIADIKPWFGGQLALGVTALPSTGDGESGADAPPGVVISASVTDRAALDAWLGRARATAEGEGIAFAEEAYAGRTLVRVTGGDAAPGSTAAYVVTDSALILGARVEDVRAAVDLLADDANSLARSAAFSEQLAKLPADRLGAFYVDLDAVTAALRESLGEMPGGGAAAMGLDALPRSFAMAIRAESDRMLVEVRAVPGEGSPQLTSRATTLAELVPFDAAVYAEGRDAGKQIETMVGQLLVQLEGVVADEQLEMAEEFLGTPVEEFLDWLQDLAIVADLDEGGTVVGLVATVTDEVVAAQRVERLTTALRAATAFAELPFEVTDEDHDGTTVTVIRVTDADALPPGTPVESISYAISDGRFLLGTGTFVTDALDRDRADSLAANPRFADALTAAGGATHAGVVFVDVARLRTQVEALIPADARGDYELEVKPYLEPLDRFISLGQVDGTDLVARVLVYVE